MGRWGGRPAGRHRRGATGRRVEHAKQSGGLAQARRGSSALAAGQAKRQDRPEDA
jgi:hypothetical protein